MAENDWGELIYQYTVGLFKRDSGIWTGFGLAGGLDGSGCVFAALADSDDSIHTFWSAGDNRVTDELVCDTVLLDSATNKGAACLDTVGRVQCTWILSGRLKFAVPGHETWIVQDSGNPVWCDITTDTLSQPVIAYCRADGSIWVAHGVGIVGLSSEPRQPAARSLAQTPSIVRNVLFLSLDRSQTGIVPRASLLDLTGRKVMDLRPGANDVRALAPGAYFVREAQVQAQPQAARTVVVTR